MLDLVSSAENQDLTLPGSSFSHTHWQSIINDETLLISCCQRGMNWMETLKFKKKKIDWLHWFFSFAAYISGQFLNDALYRKPAYSCYCRIDDSMKQHSLPTLMFCVLTQAKVKAVRLFFSRAGSLFFSSCNQPANSYLLEQQWRFVFCNNCVHTILHNSLHKSRLVWWSGLS